VERPAEDGQVAPTGKEPDMKSSRSTHRKLVHGILASLALAAALLLATAGAAEARSGSLDPDGVAVCQR